MITRRLTRVVGIVTLLAATAWAPAGAADAERGPGSCTDLLVGTFLTTELDSSGDFAARALFTFHDDGTVSAVVSRQTSGETGTSFSSQLGSYSCSDETSAVATLVDFGFPPDQDIGVFDMTMTLGDDGAVSGAIVVTLLTPLDGCEPFRAADGDGTCTAGEAFDTTFTGSRVPASR